jgi:hypothetical protein
MINDREEAPLWDPWGLFFNYLSHESGISNNKGMNLGWMIWDEFHSSFFSA